MGKSIYVQSAFAGTLNTVLTAYTPGGSDIGATYTAPTGYTGVLKLDGNGGVFNTTAGTNYASGIPTGVEYDLFWTINVLDTTANQFVVARGLADGSDGYFFYQTAAATWKIYRQKTTTLLATGSMPASLAVGTYNMKASVRDAMKSLYIDYLDGRGWILLCATTDNTVTGLEASGNRVGVGSSITVTNTTGIHIKNFSVTEIVGDYWDAFNNINHANTKDVVLSSNFQYELANTSGVPDNRTPGVDGWITHFGNVAAQSYPSADLTLNYLDGSVKTASSSGSLIRPLFGIVGTDEFTIEGEIASSVAWSSLTTNVPIIAVQGGGAQTNYGFDLRMTSSTTLRVVYARQDALTNTGVNYDRTFADLGLTAALGAAAWVNLAITYKNSTLCIIINGVTVYRLPNIVFGRFTADDRAASSGLMLNTTGVALTQLSYRNFRVKRYCRTPGAVASTPDASMTINVAGANLLSVNPLWRGSKNEPTDAYTLANLAASVGGSIIRCNSVLSATPIGTAQSSTYPTQGLFPGSPYYYNWGAVDNTLANIFAVGATPYIGLDSCPQLLGGSVAPFSAADIAAGKTTTQQPWSQTVPGDTGIADTNFTKFCTMRMDVILYVQQWCIANGKTFPLIWGDWNEVWDFWSGTATQWRNMTTTTLQYMATLGIPGLKMYLGGGIEIRGSSGTLNGSLVASLLADAVANGLTAQVAGFEVHSYDDINHLQRQATALSNRMATASWPGSLSLLVGELGNDLSLARPQPWVSTASTNNEWDLITTWAATNWMATGTVSAPNVTGITARIYTATSNITNATINGRLLNSVLAKRMSVHNLYILLKMLDGFSIVTAATEIWPGVTSIGISDGTNAYALLSYMAYDRVNSVPVPVDITFTGIPACSPVRIWTLDKDHGNYGMGGTETLPSPTTGALNASSKYRVTMTPRTVVLVATGTLVVANEFGMTGGF